MNSYYFGRSALECLSKAHGSAVKGIGPLNSVFEICDLAPQASTMVLAASLMTSFGMLMFKAAQVEVLSLKIKEGCRLEKEREELVIPLHGSPASIGQQLAAAPQLSAGSNGPVPRAAAAALQAAARHDDSASESEFMTSRQPPPPAASRSLQSGVGRADQAQPRRGLTSIQVADDGDEEEEAMPEVRGVCEGCGEYVMSNDGRWREDDKYYHLECMKGRCGGCGLIVHANDERVRLSGVYWHHECDSHRAESSRAGAERAWQEQSRS
jgi:hypothetical protein